MIGLAGIGGRRRGRNRRREWDNTCTIIAITVENKVLSQRRYGEPGNRVSGGMRGASGFEKAESGDEGLKDSLVHRPTRTSVEGD